MRLRAALRRSDVVDAARSWERLRVAGATLTPNESVAARAARLAVGRAIRVARWRRAHPDLRPRPEAEIVALPRDTRPFQRALLAVAGVGLASIVVVALLPGLRPSPAPAGGPADEGSHAVATLAPSGVKGRTNETPPPVAAVPAATPPPTVPPTVAPTEAPAPPQAGPVRTGPVTTVAPGAVPGVGGPGGPGGPGGGGPGGTGIVPVTPSPAPILVYPPGTPAPLRLGESRFYFRVIDYNTKAPVPLVCVIVGTQYCGPSDYHTNADGIFVFEIDPSALLTRYSFAFLRDDYWPLYTAPLTWQSGDGQAPLPINLRHK